MYVSCLRSAHSNSTLFLGVLHRPKLFAFGGAALGNFVKGLCCKLCLYSITRSATCRRVVSTPYKTLGCLIRALIGQRQQEAHTETWVGLWARVSDHITRRK